MPLLGNVVTAISVGLEGHGRYPGAMEGQEPCNVGLKTPDLVARAGLADATLTSASGG